MRTRRSGCASYTRARIRSSQDFGLCPGTTAKKLEYTTVGFQLLPEKFSLTELQGVTKSSLIKKLDKRNFRRKAAEDFETMSQYRRAGPMAVRLYRFAAVRSRETEAQA